MSLAILTLLISVCLAVEVPIWPTVCLLLLLIFSSPSPSLRLIKLWPLTTILNHTYTTVFYIMTTRFLVRDTITLATAMVGETTIVLSSSSASLYYCFNGSPESVYIIKKDLCCIAMPANQAVPPNWLSTSTWLGVEVVNGQKVNHWYGVCTDQKLTWGTNSIV